ncbi:hypothetical protein ACJMK2_042861 [Sinanodonta woodiana]|uniref:Retropepsins domain-containing protein n=1 Tax=Sinanodonta woodiana TaxID=1069815 RepID=A0ABD3VV44_SINWO
MCSKNSNNGIYIEAEISGVQVLCLLDTGSTLSVLHPNRYLAIPEEIRPPVEYKSFQLRMADGGLIPIQGCVTLPIKINGKVFNHRLIIADIQAPVVLGYDFLFDYECKIDVAESKLFIGGSSVQCLLESDLPRVCRISIMENVIVPAGTEMIVQARVDGKFGYSTMAVIEADNSKLSEKGVLVARTVVDPSSGKVPLRVVNISDQPCRMYRCKNVASCFMIHRIVTVNDIQEPFFGN